MENDHSKSRCGLLQHNVLYVVASAAGTLTEMALPLIS
jgi:hypothetical protein